MHPYYTNGTYFVWYEFGWTIKLSLDNNNPPEYTGGDGSTVPNSWSTFLGQEPAPTHTTGCGGGTTPAGAFVLSDAGTSAVNGCYSEAGTYNGKPYYSNGTYFVWYEGFEFSWFISQSVGGGPPDYYGSNENDVPSIWDLAVGPSPPPTLSQGCGGGYSSSFNFNIDFVP
jgi:hypothetical protein